MFKKVLVGYDGSPGARKALSKALELCAGRDSELWCLSVEEKLPAYASTVGEVEEEKARITQFFENILKEASERARAVGIHLRTHIMAGHPAQTIVRFAEEGGFDLIVVGHSGSSGAWGRFLGTTTEKLTRHAHCSVLVVR